jgi:hypothetical protein
MALPNIYPLDVIHSAIAYSPSTGTSPTAAYVPAPVRGQIVGVRSTTYGAITTANCSVAIAINGGSSIGTLTIPVASAAAGQYTL